MGLFGPDIKGMKKRQDFEALINCLKDSNASVRYNVCVALGELQNNRALRPLIHTLKDPDVGVRSQAILALGNIKDPLAVKPLVEAFNVPENSNSRTTIIDSLEKIRTTEAIQALADFYMEGKEVGHIEEAIKRNGEPALKILDQTKKIKSEKTIHPLLISYIKKILGNRPVEAIGIAYSSVDAFSSSITSDLIYIGLMGPSFGKRLAPKTYKANLILISVNKEELSLINLGKLNLDNLLIDPIITLLSLNTVISKDIQSFPIKKITINYDEKNNTLIINGDLNTSLFLPEFINYSNSLNTQKIVQVVDTGNV